jgi:3-hydroxyisobutyrate dehydrogenase-like beta-hydroxyacid dehydrogenase
VSDPALLTVGWIGLGDMGLPMAANLGRAGHRVRGYDLDEARLAAAQAAGVARASSGIEAAAGADVVVTMLRTGAQTEELLTGTGGLAESVPDGRELDVVVMSTLEPESMRRLAHLTAGRLCIVDAPVSGGVQGAEAGTLAIMAAGRPAALARVRPLFEILGGSTFELGSEPGYGQAAKLANQVMMAASIAGTFEALALSRAYGLEDERVSEAVTAGTGASWVLEHWPSLRGLWEAYVPGNALDILVKDLRAVIANADARGVAMPVAGHALSQLLDARGPD